VAGPSHRLLVLAVAGFVAMAMPSAAIGVAWPQIASELHRPIASLGYLLAAFGAGFLVTTTWSGSIRGRLGPGRMLRIAALVATVSLIALGASPSWPLLLVATSMLGAAGGLVDSGLNVHVSLRHGPRAMGMLHAGFGIGSTLGPLGMTMLVGAGRSWRTGFFGLAVVQGAVLVGFLLLSIGWEDPEPVEGSSSGSLTLPFLVVGLVVFFLYTGVEVGSGQWSFSLLAEGRAVSARIAGWGVSAYWGALTAARLSLGAFGDRFAPRKMVTWGTVLACAGLGLLWWGPGTWVSLGGLVIAGFGLGPLFPLLVLRTARAVGPRAAPRLVGFQIAAANVGASLLPLGVGLLVAAGGLEAVGPSLTTAAVALALAALGIGAIPTGRTDR
jgi:fucose permease